MFKKEIKSVTRNWTDKQLNQNNSFQGQQNFEMHEMKQTKREKNKINKNKQQAGVGEGWGFGGGKLNT